MKKEKVQKLATGPTAITLYSSWNDYLAIQWINEKKQVSIMPHKSDQLEFFFVCFELCDSCSIIE